MTGAIERETGGGENGEGGRCSGGRLLMRTTGKGGRVDGSRRQEEEARERERERTREKGEPPLAPCLPLFAVRGLTDLDATRMARKSEGGELRSSLDA
jgi:hypothetical protein